MARNNVIIPPTTSPRSTIANTTVIGIHKGLVTHHRDQPMTPVSLRIRKTMNNINIGDIPAAESFTSFMICYSFPLFPIPLHWGVLDYGVRDMLSGFHSRGIT